MLSAAASGDDLGDDRPGELLRGGLGAAEGRFEAVAKGHELVNLGDDAGLFGEGGKSMGARIRSAFVSLFRPVVPAVIGINGY